jgi:hypothetical protein
MMNITYNGTIAMENGFLIQDSFMNGFISIFTQKNVTIESSSGLTTEIDWESQSMSCSGEVKDKLFESGKTAANSILSPALSPIQYSNGILLIVNDDSMKIGIGYGIRESIVLLNGLKFLFKSYSSELIKSDIVTVQLKFRYFFQPYSKNPVDIASNQE